MKASLKLREDQKPLFRAKVPLSILGFPFQSGIAAGDSKELCLNLSTFFESGPSLKIAYRPNDSWNPFSLIVKTGVRHFGSPISSPMTMSAEFNLVGRGNPSFFLHFRPQFGDFSIKKSAGSLIALSSQPSVFLPKIKSNVNDHDSDVEASVEGGEAPLQNDTYRPENGIFSSKKSNGFYPEPYDAGAIARLFSGVEVNAGTALPLRKRAVLKFRWGVRFPPELKTAFTDGGIRNSTAQISLRKIPFLVMSKISIEHLPDEDSNDNTKRGPATLFPGNIDAAAACFTVKHQLEALQAENGLLRKAVEELRSDFRGGKPAPVPGSQDSGKHRESVRSAGKSSAGRNDRRDGEKKSSEHGGFAEIVTEGDAEQELKKALH